MIKEIEAKGFKGMDFSQPLYPKTIICGPNGSGKSARSLAISLILMGYVPGSDKKNPAILAAFGHQKLTVGAKINGTTLHRQWKKTPKGAVNQAYLVDTKKSKKDGFIAALAQAGNPKIFDLSVFMELSDQKKIDYLFNLFPPSGDVSELDDQIIDLSEKLNKKRTDVRNAESFVSKTMANRAQIELPSGTLAETSSELESTKKELSDAQEMLKKAEIAKAEADERARMEKEASEKSDIAIETPERTIEPEGFRQVGRGERVDSWEEPVHHGRDTVNVYKGPYIKDAAIEINKRCADSIEKIMAAIESVGCAVCTNGAAMMVARSELKKYV